MSMFKSSGIILKIEKQKENGVLLDIFSQEYGKIKLKAKNSKIIKSLDIGYAINFEIDVRKENQIHRIRNIKIKSNFEYIDKNYETILEYLELLKIINEKCPLFLAIPEIYDLVNEINTFKNITAEKIIFSKLKVLNILGILKTENHDPKISKILSFIEKENIRNILKLKGLKEDEKNKLNDLTKII